MALFSGERTVELPSGARAELRPLVGADEDWLSSCDPTNPTAAVVTQLLARCTVRIGANDIDGPSPIRDLLVADRDYLLLQLRAVTFGSRFDAVLECPHCAARMDVSFDASDVPVTVRPASVGRHEVQVTTAGGARLQVGFHLPTGADQESAASAPAEPVAAMLASCVEDLNGEPAGMDLTDLDELAIAQLEDAMEAIAPSVDLAMDLRCPECEHEFPADYVITPFLLQDMRLPSDQLMREVHALAYHYHWSEAEILKLSRFRRRTYLALISDELRNGVEA